MDTNNQFNKFIKIVASLGESGIFSLRGVRTDRGQLYWNSSSCDFCGDFFTERFLQDKWLDCLKLGNSTIIFYLAEIPENEIGQPNTYNIKCILPSHCRYPIGEEKNYIVGATSKNIYSKLEMRYTYNKIITDTEYRIQFELKKKGVAIKVMLDTGPLYISAANRGRDQFLVLYPYSENNDDLFWQFDFFGNIFNRAPDDIATFLVENPQILVKKQEIYRLINGVQLKINGVPQ